MSAEGRTIAEPLKFRIYPVVTAFIATASAIAFGAMSVVFITTFLMQVTRVTGSSMQPTLEDSDCVLVNRLSYELGMPHTGDIVTLYYPANPDRVFVKRVIATEGQSVQIVDGRVFVDTAPVRDDYVRAAFRSHEKWGPELVDEGYYFVMGDHRNNSSDSREWGFVPRKYVIGRVTLRWWPLGHFTIF